MSSSSASTTAVRPEYPRGPFSEEDILRNNFELLERMARADGKELQQGQTMFLKSKTKGEYFLVLVVTPGEKYVLVNVADKGEEGKKSQEEKK